MTDSIGRRFAAWGAGLRYEDLPAPVVEKVKSLLLHHLVGSVFAYGHRRIADTVELVRNESPRADGARILGDDLGPRVSREGAVHADAEILNIARLNDSFRMITHPGPVLIAAGLVNAELEGRSTRDLITALAFGYEVECRLADDFVPSVSAHAFRPAPIFSTMGAAMVAGKLLGLDEDGLLAALGVAANVASGLNESRRDARTGGNENGVHQANAARQGTYAAVMAHTGRVRGSEWIIEGPAGFYAAFAGSRDGSLTYSFDGASRVDLASITAGLGRDWTSRHVMFRIYPVAGFDQPVIELMTRLRAEHRIDRDAVASIEVTVNELETLYPSPAFPRDPEPTVAKVGSIQYFLAHVAVNGGYPVIGGEPFGPTGTDLEGDRRVLDFMRDKVRLVGEPGRPMFSPRIVVRRTDGTEIAGDFDYADLEWSFEELVERLGGCVPGLPGGRPRLDALVETVARLEDLDSLDPIFAAVRR